MGAYLSEMKSQAGRFSSIGHRDVNYHQLHHSDLGTYINLNLVIAIVTCIFALNTRYPSFADSDAVGSRKNSSSSSLIFSSQPGSGLLSAHNHGGGHTRFLAHPRI
jgi:hypothetical protein